MINTHQMSQNLSIPMPITQDALQIAEEFSSEQPTQQKAIQVYFNTLTVSAVNNYLRILDIPTNLTVSDSWNPLLRLMTDVADLWVTGLGRLECRPLSVPQLDLNTAQSSNHNQWLKSIPQTQSTPQVCWIPPEVQCGRIGYIIVQIELAQQEAILLGFSKTVETDELPLNQLQPIYDLIQYLDIQDNLCSSPIKLSQWIQGIFESEWQSLTSFFDSRKFNYAFRRKDSNGIQRTKIIELETPFNTVAVALVVTLSQPHSADFDITLQVLPLGAEIYLPVGLSLSVLDERGETFLQLVAESNDNLLQTGQFGGKRGERFSVQISLDEEKITEEFII